MVIRFAMVLSLTVWEVTQNQEKIHNTHGEHFMSTDFLQPWRVLGAD